MHHIRRHSAIFANHIAEMSASFCGSFRLRTQRGFVFRALGDNFYVCIGRSWVIFICEADGEDKRTFKINKKCSYS